MSLEKKESMVLDIELERVFDVGLKMNVEDFSDKPSADDDSHELEVRPFGIMNCGC